LIAEVLGSIHSASVPAFAADSEFVRDIKVNFARYYYRRHNLLGYF